MSEKVYKTAIGAIPKIVNNFKPRSDIQKLFANKISDFNHQFKFLIGSEGNCKTMVSCENALKDG